jgi:hypothetical protein
MFYISGLCITTSAARAIYAAQRGRVPFVSFRRWKKSGRRLNVGRGICAPYTNTGSTLVYSSHGAGSGYVRTDSIAIRRILAT